MAKTKTKSKTSAPKPLIVALGAGSLAVDKARELPTQVRTLPGTLTSRIGSLPTDVAQRARKLRPNGNTTIALDVRSLPKTAQRIGTAVPERASELVDNARKLTADTQERARKVYADLTKEGEKVYKKLSKRSKNGTRPKRTSGARKPAAQTTTAATPTPLVTPPSSPVTTEPAIGGQQSL